MERKIFTNCFLVRADDEGKPIEVCLGMKKRGFGEGLWNGSGGKPKADEPVEVAARREVEEEFGVKIGEFHKRAEIVFWLAEEQSEVEMHAFVVMTWEGEPEETEEMKPAWFRIDEVPFGRMWKSDCQWLPALLAGKTVRGRFEYQREGGELVSGELVEVGEF